MWHRTRKTGAVAALCVGALVWFVAASGCSTDPSAEQGDTGNLRAPPDDPQPDTAGDTADADGAGLHADAEGDDAGDPEDRCDGRVCDRCVACKFREPAERSCTPEEGEPPQRCEADPSEFQNWGAGSVLTHFEIASEEAKNCCFNIDGSKGGSPDNELGKVADGLPFDVDREIKERLTTGGFATVVEHDGLRRLDRPQSFSSNVHVGYFADDAASDYLRNTESDCDLATEDCDVESSSGESFLVSPEGLEEGAHPQVQFHPAEMEDHNWTGGPSKVVLDFGVRGVGDLSLRIHGATIEGDVDELVSEPNGEGITVDNGRLGGYVLLKDAAAMLNQLMGSCECLDEPEAAIHIPNDEDDEADAFPAACESGDAEAGECELSCTESVEEAAGSCGSSSGVVCSQAGDICGAIPLLSQFADLDADHDGQIDALSVGAIFEMKGARIEGVADYVKAPDQPVGSSDELTVDRAFVNEPGWIAVYSEGSLNPESKIGHRWLEPGNHAPLTVDVSELEAGSTVHVVLHRDNGPETETFEPDEDRKVKRYPEMSGYVSDTPEIEAE